MQRRSCLRKAREGKEANVGSRWPDYARFPTTEPDFAWFVATMLEDLGYVVSPLSPSNGYGATLVAVDPATGRRIAVATRLSPGGLLGAEAVQQVAAAMPIWGASEGWVVTNAEGFTPDACRLAPMYGIRLVANGDLSSLVAQAASFQALGQPAMAPASSASTAMPVQAPSAAPAVSSYYGPQTTMAFEPVTASYPPMDPGPMGMPVLPQMPEKKSHMGCLWSILITLVVLILLLAAYVFLAPMLFDAIEASNPGLHILRWNEVAELIAPS